MQDPDAYVALICSLPRSERLFVAKQPPLSRLRLDQRLRALTPDHAETLAMLEHALSWSGYSIDVTDADATERCAATLKKIPQPTLREVFAHRMDMRTAVAALRLRRRGDSQPTGRFGISRWSRHIVQHWNEPQFGLEPVMPWLKEADQFLEKDDPLGLERLLLSESHKALRRYAGRHTFDFEAVALYVLTWNIFDRWAHSNAEDAAKRFEALAQEAMANVAGADTQGAST